jgi:hypothetical protein
MGFRKTVPGSASELGVYMHKLHDNRGHVKKVEVNVTTGALQVTLDGPAHFAGNPDVYLPIRRSQAEQAKILIERMMSHSAAGYPPSDTDVRDLFGMIDPMGA